jgi:hypothetical protein
VRARANVKPAHLRAGNGNDLMMNSGAAMIGVGRRPRAPARHVCHAAGDIPGSV